jgi:two-component system, chemotaxis family, chemotaxis protein CheY
MKSTKKPSKSTPISCRFRWLSVADHRRCAARGRVPIQRTVSQSGRIVVPAQNIVNFFVQSCWLDPRAWRTWMDAPALFAELTVLVVEDDAAVRNLICNMLRRLRVAATAFAEDGKQGLQLYRAAPTTFDLVICDWNMPVMTGLELCTQVRADRPDLPFLMVTGRNDIVSVRTALRSGVSAYIVKPFSPLELKKKISFLIDRYRKFEPIATSRNSFVNERNQ